jgi:Protein of unknown function (DUF3179)
VTDLRAVSGLMAKLLAGIDHCNQGSRWHEIVNDAVGETLIAVTWCPLCNSSVMFDRRVASRTLSFGTTGKLRNSDLVMYDRETDSWWQQFGGE